MNPSIVMPATLIPSTVMGRIQCQRATTCSDDITAEVIMIKQQRDNFHNGDIQYQITTATVMVTTAGEKGDIQWPQLQ